MVSILTIVGKAVPQAASGGMSAPGKPPVVQAVQKVDFEGKEHERNRVKNI